MATYDITSASFNVLNIQENDILNCPYTGDETTITLPPGRYKFDITGASGNFGGNQSTTDDTYRAVGGGGSSTGILEATDEVTLYINVGGCGETYIGTASTVRQGGYNGGGTANYYGGVGGGATHIATRSGLLSELEDYKDTILIVAGGGGGSNYYSGNSKYYGNGGNGGGTQGTAGTNSGSASTQYAGQPGTQTSGGAAGTNSTRKGQAGSFGQGGNQGTGTTSYSSSAGGGGYYGGGAGSNQEGGGGGGSGYVSSVLESASTTVGSSTTEYTNGSVSITVLYLSNVDKINLTLNLSGGNYTSNDTNGTQQIYAGASASLSFIPLSEDDPITAYKNGTDITSTLTHNTITQGVTITTKAPDASYGFNLNNGWYVSANKGTAKSAAVARVNIVAATRTTATFTVINYAEEGYDFGVLGDLDHELEPVYNSDNSGYWSGFNKNSSSQQQITYDVPIGEHFIDVKYIKDDATDTNNDTLQFKVDLSPAAGVTTTEYHLTVNDIQTDTEIKIICGDVSKNFHVAVQAAHASANPQQETLYQGSNFELHFVPTDTNDYTYIGVYDNNVDKTADVIAPHTLSAPSYEVTSYSGASYGFNLTNGYYQSANTANNTAALCKVVFNSPVPARVNLIYQNTGYSTYNFSMISELNTDLRTDSATDTSGMAINGSSNFHSTDTEYSFDIPAGESYIVCKHKITRTSSTTGNLKFKIDSITPLESLDVPYYTYIIQNVQEAHQIIIISQEIPYFNVNVDCGPMGAITNQGINRVKQGQSITIECTPETNYNVNKIFVNSSSVTFSGNSYTLSNVQGDANIYVLFSSGETQFYWKSSTGVWIPVAQVYKKVDGRWVEQDFELIGDPNTKYIRKGGDTPIRTLVTQKLIPSTYQLSNASYLTIADANNMYDDTDSTTYARITHNRAATTAYYLYVRGFNFSDIPSDVEIESFTIRFKANESGLSTNTTYAPTLVNNTTQVTGSANAVTTSVTTTQFTDITATWDTIKNYGDNFGIRFPLRRNTTNTSGYLNLYGAEIEVSYYIEV